ncbi:MAG: nucleotide-binding protein [Alphaproteobacteria bacterium]|nr:nucleotide-binding protein [Alphaproteobacteria bacterium]
MANKFTGTYQELQDKVNHTGFKGEWKELSSGQKQFRTETGICLNWWDSSKTINIQGPDGENKHKFEEAFFNALNNICGNVMQAPQSNFVPSIASKKIFIVHGHDDTSLRELELFIMRLGLEPYILKNNVEGGKTIIEALEQRIVYDSAFGIVLMTPDDVGCSKKDYEQNNCNLRSRARQNVILEMGILIGSIGRHKVAILRKGDIEDPSDVSGLLYVPFKDSVIKEAGNSIIKHMQAAGIPIDPNKINTALS